MRKHKGVYYFDKRETAESALKALEWPNGRIVEYERGFAVQVHKSGPYLPEVIELKYHKCDWCPLVDPPACQ